MSKERDVEVLKHKIAELEVEIEISNKYNISDKKINKLEILKMKYEDQLAELEFGD